VNVVTEAQFLLVVAALHAAAPGTAARVLARAGPADAEEAVQPV
jgi:hypothetical protein